MHKALVTGGTRGIGRGIAEAIAADGGHVVITGRSARAAEDAAAEMSSAAGAGRVTGLALDVRDRANVERVVAESATKLGGLNVLINNAGVGVFKDVADMPDEDWARVIDTNLSGVFYCIRAALPELRRARGAWIINIASLAGRNYFASAGAYCASKAGLVALSESVMLEERERDIRVSVVMPGSVATEFSHPRGSSDDSWKLTPADVAQVVMDLLHTRSKSLPSKVEIRPARTK